MYLALLCTLLQIKELASVFDKREILGVWKLFRQMSGRQKKETVQCNLKQIRSSDAALVDLYQAKGGLLQYLRLAIINKTKFCW